MTRKIQRRQRARTSQTVVRTHLAIITAVSTGGEISVRAETELVKAGLLYADDIEVLSLGNQMVRSVSAFTDSDPSSLWTFLGLMSDDTLQKVDPGIDAAKLRFGLLLMQSADPAFAEILGQMNPESKKEIDEFAQLMRETSAKTDAAMNELRGVAAKIAQDSGAAELETARGLKLVRFNENVNVGEDSETVMNEFVDEVTRYISDPHKFVLLDATIASLVDSMIKEGLIQPPPRAMSNAAEAAIGTGLLALLPTFTEPPLDEIIDLRRDLDGPLVHYRTKVADLRGHLQTGPLDRHIDAEIESIWRQTVEPALTDIRAAMAGHGLVRDLIKRASGNLGDFAKGTWLPAALAVAAGATFDLGTAVTAGLTGLAVSSPTIGQTIKARLDNKDAARRHDLFYLYEVDRRLSGRR